MIHRTELISIHILDLLELLEADPGKDGSLRLIVGDEEVADVDFDDLCLVVQTNHAQEPFASDDDVSCYADVIPLPAQHKGGC